MRKEIPILLSVPMVIADLAGNKTETRRTKGLERINEDPSAWRYCGRMFMCPGGYGHRFQRITGEEMKPEDFVDIRCSYGEPGDLHYVREEHYQFGNWVENGQTKKGSKKWAFVAMSDVAFFDPPEVFYTSRQKGTEHSNLWYKRIGLFMPKKLSRIWHEVVSVHCEMLKDIDYDGAISEGIEVIPMPGSSKVRFKNYVKGMEGDTMGDPRLSYLTLWESINGKDSWYPDTWVFVVKYKVVSTTGKPKEI